MTIRKHRLLLLVLLTASCFCSGFSQNSYENLYNKDLQIVIPSEKEREYLKTNPILTVVCDSDWQPFEYLNQTLDIPQYTGINYLLLKKVASKAGIELKFITTKTYSESLNYFVSGHADILTGYSTCYIHKMSYLSL